MTKKYHLKTEYSIFILAIVGIILLVMPLSVENTRQANFISKWNEKFNRIEYMFSVINAHKTSDMLKSLNDAQTPQEREHILLMIIKPYLRINTEKFPKHYKPRCLNGSKINSKHAYYFNELYYAENNTIVGIKDISEEKSEDPLFLMMFDINGTLPPNRWGKDIYGIRIYDEGIIKPFGEDLDMSKIKEDCSNSGTGGACSYYYKIGGDFDD